MTGSADSIEGSCMRSTVFVNRWSGVQISHPAPNLSPGTKATSRRALRRTPFAVSFGLPGESQRLLEPLVALDRLAASLRMKSFRLPLRPPAEPSAETADACRGFAV